MEALESAALSSVRGERTSSWKLQLSPASAAHLIKDMTCNQLAKEAEAEAEAAQPQAPAPAAG